MNQHQEFAFLPVPHSPKAGTLSEVVMYLTDVRPLYSSSQIDEVQ
jgi:hypothetical protein